MNENQFQTLSDAELDQAAGGVEISLTLGEDGVSFKGPLGELKIPNLFAIAGDAIGSTLGAAGEILKATGGVLTDVGGLFKLG
ncbi:MAG: hypothetical protein ABW321_23395 [Polyangiales bacterium]